MNGRWWMHPGLWMMAGALAYPLGGAITHVIMRWSTGAERGYAFGA